MQLDRPMSQELRAPDDLIQPASAQRREEYKERMDAKAAARAADAAERDAGVWDVDEEDA